MAALPRGLTTIVLANSAALTTNVKLGLAGAGVVGLASNVTQLAAVATAWSPTPATAQASLA